MPLSHFALGPQGDGLQGSVSTGCSEKYLQIMYLLQYIISNVITYVEVSLENRQQMDPHYNPLDMCK